MQPAVKPGRAHHARAAPTREGCLRHAAQSHTKYRAPHAAHRRHLEREWRVCDGLVRGVVQRSQVGVAQRGVDADAAGGVKHQHLRQQVQGLGQGYW